MHGVGNFPQISLWFIIFLVTCSVTYNIFKFQRKKLRTEAFTTKSNFKTFEFCRRKLSQITKPLGSWDHKLPRTTGKVGDINFRERQQLEKDEKFRSIEFYNVQIFPV